MLFGTAACKRRRTRKRGHPLQLCTQKALAMAVRTVMMNWITFDMFSFFILILYLDGCCIEDYMKEGLASLGCGRLVRCRGVLAALQPRVVAAAEKKKETDGKGRCPYRRELFLVWSVERGVGGTAVHRLPSSEHPGPLPVVSSLFSLLWQSLRHSLAMQAWRRCRPWRCWPERSP